MSAERTCSECGAPLPANAPGNRCPACLLRLALEDAAAPDVPEKTVALPDPDVVPERSGMTIGRYRLLQQIGEGGFGVVFMAEQTEPVQRKVALKIIKAGMDTREVIARFEAERQALALMDHPNIAKVLDAGTTGSPLPSDGRGVRGEGLSAGRPYFVMELVHGLPITTYCDHANLSTRERLELFIKVCRAVQHAHQKGVIHRDLKPTNVLVTLHDGEAVPKVIDFGVAKALGQKLTDKTLFTRFEQMIGTPAYMSPEQAALSGLDIDTRSDIYSLGVLLYELLTGVTPLDAETLRQGALDEIRRMIRETEPPRPSTRLMTLGERLADVARCRQAEPAALSRLIRGDLDWITMKALEKDRQRRYETVNGLAMDVERHLKNEPVVARPPSALYRLEKAARRHRVAFAAGTAVAVALLSGIAVSTWQMVRATRASAQALAEKRRADQEAATAIRITEALQQMLAAANPDTTKGLDYSVRQMLDDFADQAGKNLANEPEAEATLQATIGNAYWRLGEHAKGRKHLERALELRGRSFGTQHEKYADTLVDLAWALHEQGQDPEAEAKLREALALYRQRGVGGLPLIRALRCLQVILHSGNRWSELEPVVNEALAEAAKSPGVEFPEIANIYHGLIAAKIAARDYVEAERLARLALALHLKLQGPDHPETGWGYVSLANALAAARTNSIEALEAGEHALAIFRMAFPPDHRYLGHALVAIRDALSAAADSAALSQLFASAEKLGDLESRLRRMLATKLSRPNDPFDPVNVATSLLSRFPEYYHNLGRELAAAGKQEAAQGCEQRVSALLAELTTEPAPDPERTRTLARLLHASGKTAEATNLYVNLLARQRKELGAADPALGATLFEFAEFLLFSARDAAAAAEHYLQALPIRRAGPDADLAWNLRNLGAALQQVGRFKESEPYCREGLAVYRKVHPQDDVNSGWVQYLLAKALYFQGQLPEAELCLRQALRSYLESTGGTHSYTLVVLDLLTDVLNAQGKRGEVEALGSEIVRVADRAKNADQAAALYSLGLARLAVAGTQEVEAVGQKLLALSHKNPATFLNSAWSLASSTNAVAYSALAIRLAERAVATASNDVASVLSLAEIYFRVGRTNEAVATFARMIQSATNKADAYWRRALFHERNQQYEKALTDFEQAVKLKPDSAEFNRQLAWNYARYPEKFRSPEKGLPFALRAVELSRTNATELNTLGVVYLEMGRLPEAIAVLTQAIGKNRAMTAPLYWRTEAHIRQGEYEKAIADYEARLALTPNDGQICNALAWGYVTWPAAVRSPEKALPLALKAVELSRNSYAELNTLGVVYYRLGQWQKAIETLEAACKADKDGGGSADFFFLAASYHQLGDAAKAKDFFAKATTWQRSHADQLSKDSLDELESFRVEAEQVLSKALSN